ncbi:NAD-dependent epimerase/dehydratase family protein [Curvibacter sp. HBC61]|uniref:NAD-dependent epimerase/dehydratase family protein n=1 Tax=Curvibacter cyanobacteriorum TaxID=3026422 RepID=A0ABT5MWK4_9BURK|nr:NAD-dependent epimerase/dehydratase family protein [Curvibacter sp. HBC61]MDD0838429.1 NAD-dependent epimerase/dehydratase family protein [Curvibacter sp. HBC61]
MRILLTGSTGFVGRHLQPALQQAGHEVLGGVSPARAARSPNGVAMDFARDTTPGAWLPRLAGVDCVINAVGVLRDSAARPIDAVHRDTPIALFEACAQAGVRRVVQVSALGIADSPTRYARTKRAADEHLLSLHARGALSALVLRPSVVFGRGGDSSALFMNLAKLPLALLPGPMLTARVQPVSVHDLTAAVVASLGRDPGPSGVLTCAGPQALSLAALVASLREQNGQRPAQVLRLPDLLTALSARIGDLLPASVPWCSETLAMLGSDNVGDATAFEALLGRPAVAYRDLLAQAWR